MIPPIQPNMIINNSEFEESTYKQKHIKSVLYKFIMFMNCTGMFKYD